MLARTWSLRREKAHIIVNEHSEMLYKCLLKEKLGGSIDEDQGLDRLKLVSIESIVAYKF